MLMGGSSLIFYLICRYKFTVFCFFLNISTYVSGLIHPFAVTSSLTFSPICNLKAKLTIRLIKLVGLWSQKRNKNRGENWSKNAYKAWEFCLPSQCGLFSQKWLEHTEPQLPLHPCPWSLHQTLQIFNTKKAA